jgi:hypothetical protein
MSYLKIIERRHDYGMAQITKEFYVHGVNLCNLFLFMFSVLNLCLLWLDTERSEGGMARHGFGSIF